ncbi:MAG: diguanylate cyclase, partial [Gemmatimonadota bacterium]|nr:diguanylate cyclase [Gemmatimonadota bacterium]
MTLDAISVGAFDFIIKPVQMTRLNIVVANGMNQRKINLHNKMLISELQVAKKDLEVRIEQRTEELKKSEIKFRSLYDRAPDVYYTVNTNGQIIDCNKMATEFFGVTKQALKSMHLLDLYSSDNFELISKMVPTPEGKGGKIRQQEVRVKRADGPATDVEINTNLLYDHDGGVIGALTIQRDISDRKETERQLRESEEKYRTIFQTAKVVLVEVEYSELKDHIDKLEKRGVKDLQAYLKKNSKNLDRITHMIKVADINSEGVKLFGAKNKKEMLGVINRFFLDKTYENFFGFVSAVAHGTKTFYEEMVFKTLDGKRINTLVSLAMPKQEKRFRNLLVSLVNITDRKKIEQEKDLLFSKLQQLNKQLETLAITDGLTRLYNHRFFMENISREFSRAQRSGQPLALMMVDIDSFKKFNDTYGHQLGDQVLVKVADVFRNSRRSSDIVARYGGEEFVLLLPDTDLAKAMVLAEKLRKGVGKVTISTGKKNLRVTVSLGVHAMEKSNLESPKDLLIMADKALYLAKRGGKNKVCSLEKDAAVKS